MFMGWTRRNRRPTADYADRSEAWGGATGRNVEVTFAEGIASGTLIATEQGWLPIEQVRVGCNVLTFDNGAATVLAIDRRVLWRGQGICPKGMWPLAVPAGVLGNRRAMLLLPDQNVMLESDLAEMLFGDPFALVPAAALEGYRGIARVCPHGAIEIVSLRFAEDQLVYANGSGMLHCGSVQGLDMSLDLITTAGAYLPLALDRARKLVGLMIEADEIQAALV
jgi:Hint domain